MATRQSIKNALAVVPCVIDYHFSGSRIIGCSTLDSDLDVVVHVSSGFSMYDLEKVSNTEFTPGGSFSNGSRFATESWKETYDREGKGYLINIILVWDRGVYNCWRTSLTMSGALGLLEKPYRVEWFETEQKSYEDSISESEREAAPTVGSVTPF